MKRPNCVCRSLELGAAGLLGAASPSNAWLLPPPLLFSLFDVCGPLSPATVSAVSCFGRGSLSTDIGDAWPFSAPELRVGGVCGSEERGNVVQRTSWLLQMDRVSAGSFPLRVQDWFVEKRDARQIVKGRF